MHRHWSKTGESFQVQCLQVKNLEKPWGECNDSVSLNYFKYYSIPACLLNCKEVFLVRECGCREVYMPAKNQGACFGDKKACSVHASLWRLLEKKHNTKFPFFFVCNPWSVCVYILWHLSFRSAHVLPLFFFNFYLVNVSEVWSYLFLSVFAVPDLDNVFKYKTNSSLSGTSSQLNAFFPLLYKSLSLCTFFSSCCCQDILQS